jgi:hypothetical protein
VAQESQEPKLSVEGYTSRPLLTLLILNLPTNPENILYQQLVWIVAVGKTPRRRLRGVLKGYERAESVDHYELCKEQGELRGV